MATPHYIAVKRQHALERINRAIGFTPRPVKAAADYRHAAELEQLADHLDPEGRAKPADADGTLRESPYVPEDVSTPTLTGATNEQQQQPPPEQRHDDEGGGRQGDDAGGGSGDAEQPGPEQSRVHRGRRPAAAR